MKKANRIILLFMKFNLLILFCSLGLLRASPSFSQPNGIDVSYNRASLSFVLTDLKAKTGYEFLYYRNVISDTAKVTISKTDATIEEVLDGVLPPHGLTYTIRDEVVVIARGAEPAKQQASNPQPQQNVVTGRITDERGEPLEGVSIAVKNSSKVTITQSDGRYSMPASLNDILVFTHIGMKPVEVVYRGQEAINVKMEEEISVLEGAVVNTGIFERRTESFTGSAQRFTQERLRQVGNINLVQSLSNLDPSFNIVDNNVDGSNPNVMPEIRLRGQSGFPDLRGDYQSDPNLPLFILDGFETSLTTIIDLDMNRVESVTLLKDAAAKAIYGSKAANGVVVVETVRPKSGRLQVTYAGSLDVTAPDLTSYNLTNAAEQLELEWLWRSSRVTSPHTLYSLSEIYNNFLEEVLRGVDTYWLSQPLRTGFGSKHGINLTGGDQNLTYNVDLSYNNQIGVMKGSNRNTASAGVTLAWRYKTLAFRNVLTVTYNLGKNSPYGSFDQYARMKPYYRPYDENGNVVRALPDWSGGYQESNPMWNATINTVNNSEYMQFRDNFYLEWMPIEGFKLSGRASIDRQYSGDEVFYPANHTRFVGFTSADQILRRGQYTYGDGSQFSLSGDINAGYARNFGKHFVMGNFNWSINNSLRRNVSFIAEGFPNDFLDDITFARQYLLNSRPSGSESTTRNVGFTGAANYAYANRYLFDASLRMSGSSQFGSDNRWGQFWALGLGWNLHNEVFMRNVSFINLFKIRGSLGYTGSENFNSYQSKATYYYNTNELYKGRFGAFLMGHENRGLRWQRKYDQNIGVDAGFLGNSISARFDYYVSITDDLLTDVTVPSSTGFRTYKENLGSTQNKGYEANLRYRVWHNPQKGNSATIFVGANHNKNRVREISNSLAAYNESQLENLDSRPIVRYTEGQSMSAIWAVPSYGIDPASGQEIYIQTDGTTTFTWRPSNLAVCGDREPKLRGNCGFNINYEGFSLNVTTTWRFGGQMYNQTLVDKVDSPNIANSNSDRRVFTDRWREPGDMTRFKNVQITGRTYATHRFVEDQNEISFSSIHLSYDLNRVLSLEKIGMKRLRATFNMNDVGTLSTVRLERGTAYPFARTFSFSLQAMF